ncbi:MAG: hypothetical protein ACJA0Q_001261, partial [Saprospiraceae bacterium]
MKKVLLVILMIVFVFNAKSQQEEFNHSLVWKVYKQGAKDTSYVLGT